MNTKSIRMRYLGIFVFCVLTTNYSVFAMSGGDGVGAVDAGRDVDMRAAGEEESKEGEAARPVVAEAATEPTQAAEEELCANCHDPLSDPEDRKPYAGLAHDARHKFHVKCLFDWFRNLKSRNIRFDCPLCRYIIDEHAIHLVDVRFDGVDLTSAAQEDKYFARMRFENLRVKNSNLDGAIFYKTNIEGAVFEHTRLIRADLRKAIIRGATFVDVDFCRTTFTEVDAAGARFIEPKNLSIEAIKFLQTQGVVIEKPRFDYANFSDLDLTGINSFEGAYFEIANFIRTKMAGLNFTGANFNKAHCLAVHAEGAIFDKALLHCAEFSGSHIKDTRFNGSTLTFAKFIEAHGEGAIFDGANLSGADFFKAQLQRASFKEAIFEYTRFIGAMLDGANFEKARMRGADFRGAQLQDVCFKGADLRKVIFDGANLEGADVTGANLSGATFTSGFKFALLIGLDNTSTKVEGARFLDGRALSLELARDLEQRGAKIMGFYEGYFGPSFALYKDMLDEAVVRPLAQKPDEAVVRPLAQKPAKKRRAFFLDVLTSQVEKLDGAKNPEDESTAVSVRPAKRARRAAVVVAAAARPSSPSRAAMLDISTK